MTELVQWWLCEKKFGESKGWWTTELVSQWSVGQWVGQSVVGGSEEDLSMVQVSVVGGSVVGCR